MFAKKKKKKEWIAKSFWFMCFFLWKDENKRVFEELWFISELENQTQETDRGSWKRVPKDAFKEKWCDRRFESKKRVYQEDKKAIIKQKLRSRSPSQVSNPR